MENNLLRDYVAYFRKIARAHTDIQDFKYLDIAMLQGALNSGSLRLPVLMLDTVKGGFADPDADTPVPLLEGGFMVMFPVPPDDYEAELSALEKSHRIGLEILSRMEADQETEPLFANGFSRSKVKWEALGPVADSLFGILFTFKLCVEEKKPRLATQIWNDYGSRFPG